MLVHQFHCARFAACIPFFFLFWFLKGLISFAHKCKHTFPQGCEILRMKCLPCSSFLNGTHDSCLVVTLSYQVLASNVDLCFLLRLQTKIVLFICLVFHCRVNLSTTKLVVPFRSKRQGILCCVVVVCCCFL